MKQGFIEDFILSLTVGVLFAGVLTGIIYAVSAVATWDYHVHDRVFAMALRTVFILALIIFTGVALNDAPRITGSVSSRAAIEPMPPGVQEAFVALNRAAWQATVQAEPLIAEKAPEAAAPVQQTVKRMINLND